MEFPLADLQQSNQSEISNRLVRIMWSGRDRLLIKASRLLLKSLLREGICCTPLKFKNRKFMNGSAHSIWKPFPGFSVLERAEDGVEFFEGSIRVFRSLFWILKVLFRIQRKSSNFSMSSPPFFPPPPIQPTENTQIIAKT